MFFKPFKYVLQPKIFLLSSYFFYPFLALPSEQPRGSDFSIITLKTPQGCPEALVRKYLRPKAKEMAQTGENTKHYLSIREECKEHKADAAECCSNPKSCSGLMLDIFKHATPILPSLYNAYKGYRTSDKLGSGEISHEEARAKTCDINNKTAMGGYLGGLLSQLTPLVESSCGDNIESCKEDCNDSIEDFEQEFFRCFSKVAPKNYRDDLPKGTLGRIITFAKECAELEEDDDIETTEMLEKITKRQGPHTCYLNGGSVSSSGSKIQNSEFIVEHILLLAGAYANSSDIEGTKLSLSTRATEKEMVDCSKQPHRTAGARTGPGNPVSNPNLSLCPKIVDETVKNPPPLPNMPVPSSPTTRFAGGLNTTIPLKKPNPLFFDDTGDGPLGVLEDDDLPEEPNKKPTATNIPRFSNGNGSGSTGGGPGGGLSSGAGSGFSPEEDSDDETPFYPSGEGITGSFSGGGFFPGAPGGNPSSGDYPYDDNGGEEDEEDRDIASMDEDFSDEEGMEGDQESIFNLASHRIQQFCADHSCIR